MTKEQHNYLKKQFEIIQAKKDEACLNRYESLLREAKLDEKVIGYLYRACDARREELQGRVPPLVVSAEFD